MIRIFLTAALFIGSYVANAQPPKGKAKPGDWYGSKVKTDNAVDIADITSKLDTGKSIDVKIKAKVLDVCPKKGCWVSLYVNDSTKAFVKMKDYAFFLPTAAKGKTIVLEGTAKLTETSVAELKHYAEDAKKPQAEIDAITQPQREIRLLASGITVVEQ
jgi:hypothetical protein